MGREIRRVPPNWEHPRYTKENAPYSNEIGNYMALFDEDYETAAAQWESEYAAFMCGEHAACKHCKHYWEWDDPPNEESFRPKFTEEPTWFQVYETVSEGTPTTPPFATTGELIDWLVEKGESHGTEYEKRFTRKQATSFVQCGYVLSGIMIGGRFYEGIESAELTNEAAK